MPCPECQPKEDEVTYEATIRIYAPNGLTDEQQRAWGDEMSEAEDRVAQALIDAGASFQIEVHGPDVLLAS